MSHDSGSTDLALEAQQAEPPRRTPAWPVQVVLAALLGVGLCLLVYQAPARYRVELGETNAPVVTGFGEPETNDRGGFRWTTGDASLMLPPLGTPVNLRIEATGWRPEGIAPPTLTAVLDGEVVAQWQLTRAPGVFEASAPRGLQVSGTRLELQSETFVPGPQDRRTLGVAVSSVDLSTPSGSWRPVAPPLLVLLLSALVPILIFRSARHLSLPPWPALALTSVIVLAFATAAAANRSEWLLHVPSAVLLIATVAVGTAIAPALVTNAAPVVRGAIGAIQHGLLPAWPEWEWVSSADLSVRRARLVRWVVAGLALALLLLHVASMFVPSEAEVWHSGLWGVRYVWQLPIWLPLMLSAALATLAIPAVSRGVWRGMAFVGQRPAALLRQCNPYLAAMLAGVIAMPFLWLLRSGTDAFGDALELQRKIAQEGALWREREPLDFYLHAQVYRLVNPLTGWDVPTVYALLSCVAGGFFVTVVVVLVALLARRQRDRMLAGALILTAGYMQLFVGYLESYTLMTAGLGLFLLVSLLSLAGRVGVVAPALVLSGCALLHPIALAAAPSLSLLMLDRWRRRGFGPGDGARVALAAMAGIIVPAVLFGALFLANGYTAERWEIARNQFGGGDKRTFKPLVALSSPREYYPLVSLDHVRAVTNQQLLVAPFGWPLVLALLAAARPRGLWRDPRFAFLLLAAATTFVFSALWNPDLGARQDWDLLAIGALPVMALSAFLVVTVIPRGADRRYCGLLLVGVSLYHSVLWVVVNSRLAAPWLGT